MPEESLGLAFPSDSEEKGFTDAMAAFAKDDAPEPVAAPAPAPTPEPEPEPEAATNKEAEEKTEPEKLEDEFIEFTGKQKERFNSVYGALKRLERENAEYQRRLQSFQYQQPQAQHPVAPQPAAPSQPQLLAEPKPKLADFADADSWADAVTDWSVNKAETAALSRLQLETARHDSERHQQDTVRQYNDYINGRIVEGQTKFGQREFNEAAKDVVEFAPHRSTMYDTLFGLERFPEVVVHLSKNLPEADRISSLRPHDQIYELKALEKKLISKSALAAKQSPTLPTKVEAPGAGEERKPSASVAKLRQAAKASGELRDYAAVFAADPTL